MVAAAEIVDEHLLDGFVVGNEYMADGASTDEVTNLFGQIFGVIASASFMRTVIAASRRRRTPRLGRSRPFEGIRRRLRRFSGPGHDCAFAGLDVYGLLDRLVRRGSGTVCAASLAW